VQHLDSLQNYLYTICYNLHREQYRQRKREEAQRKEISKILYIKNYEESDEEKREVAAEEQNIIDITLKAFNSLGEKCQKVLYHFYVDKITMDKIAEKLGYANADVAKTKKSQCYRRWADKVKEIQNLS